MKCQHISKMLSPYMDGQLTQEDRQSVTLHLARCAECARVVDSFGQIRGNLNSLPKQIPPPELSTSLRVIASRELSRRNARITLSALLSDWRSSLSVWMSNLMRPFAVPVAGGLVSALMLFAILLPSFIHPAMIDGSDVRTALYTEATVISTGPMVSMHEDVEVELVIDGQGRILDFTLPPSVLKNPSLRREIERDILLTRFSPATTFGLPTSGKVTISFKKLFIDVKG
jgi:anti-sigma factor RsiW